MADREKPVSDRTRSTFTQQREQREQVAVALATERLPWHPAIQERFGIERSGWRALVEAVFPAAKTSEGVILALSYCKARGLDPFKRVVHVVPIWDSVQKKMVESVWPGIGEGRTTAMRTKEYAGCDDCKFGPDHTETWSVPGKEDRRTGEPAGPDREVTVTFPEWAQFTVYRKMDGERWACPGPKVYWLETYATQSRWTDSPNEMWRKRPRGQLEKCAEAAALRRAFPEELGDEATADEMGDYSGATIDGEVVASGGAERGVTPASNTAPPPQETQAPAATQTQQPAPRKTAAAKQKATPPPATQDEETWRQEVQQGQQSPPANDQQQPPAATTNGATPPAGQAADTPPPKPMNVPPQSGFEAWLVDENGNEVSQEPFLDALQFANRLVLLCASKTPQEVADIFTINEGAIADCCDASPVAEKIINAIMEPAPPANEPPVIEGTVAQDDEPPFETTAKPAAEPPPAKVWDVLEVPKLAKGASNWPGYISLAKAELDKFTNAEDATAWLEAQKPTFVPKSIQAETGIFRHYNALLEKLTKAAPAQATDVDRQRADGYIAEVNAQTDGPTLTKMAGRPDITADLKVWEADRPELFAAVRGAATSRLKFLADQP